MDPIRGAVAGAIGGAAGAYTREGFQEWWQEMERRAAPKRRAHALKDAPAEREKSEPATVQAADRVAKKVLDRPLPPDLTPAAGEAMPYTTGASIAAVYGCVAEILPRARMFTVLLMGTLLWWPADSVAAAAQLAAGQAFRPAAAANTQSPTQPAAAQPAEDQAAAALDATVGVSGARVTPASTTAAPATPAATVEPAPVEAPPATVASTEAAPAAPAPVAAAPAAVARPAATPAPTTVPPAPTVAPAAPVAPPPAAT